MSSIANPEFRAVLTAVRSVGDQLLLGAERGRGPVVLEHQALHLRAG